MKKLLAVTAFALLSSTAMASNWAIYCSSSGHEAGFAVNVDNYKRNGESIGVWTATANIQKSVPYDLRIEYISAHCKAKTYSYSDTTLYLKGKVVHKFTESTDQEVARPNSVIDGLIDVVCNNDIKDYKKVSLSGPKELAIYIQKGLRDQKKSQGTPF